MLRITVTLDDELVDLIEYRFGDDVEYESKSVPCAGSSTRKQM